MSLCSGSSQCCLFLLFFNDPAPTVIYTLSLHDALPISARRHRHTYADHRRVLCLPAASPDRRRTREQRDGGQVMQDRKSTRLNSSHSQISYAVFCLKKKKSTPNPFPTNPTNIRSGSVGW